MKKYPKLLLQVNVEKDIENALDFLTYEKDRWFLERFFRGDVAFVLSKKFSKKDQKKIVEEYAKNFYVEHKKDIREGCTLVRRDWKKIEKEYFILVDKIFDGHPWPAGGYTGVASIFKMYPRWIEEKTFFFPNEQEEVAFTKRVIAHEMLHFIFFDFIFSKYGLREHSKIKGKENDYIWKISEVFNVVMENWKPYVDIVGKDTGSKPYPGQEKMYVKMRQQWAKNQDVNWLLDQWLK